MLHDFITVLGTWCGPDVANNAECVLEAVLNAHGKQHRYAANKQCIDRIRYLKSSNRALFYRKPKPSENARNGKCKKTQAHQASNGARYNF